MVMSKNKLEEILAQRWYSSCSLYTFEIQTPDLGVLGCCMGYNGEENIEVWTKQPIDVDGKKVDYRWYFQFQEEENLSCLMLMGAVKGDNREEVIVNNLHIMKLNCKVFEYLEKALENNPVILAVQRNKKLIWGMMHDTYVIERAKERLKMDKKEYYKNQAIINKFSEVNEVVI